MTLPIAKHDYDNLGKKNGSHMMKCFQVDYRSGNIGLSWEAIKDNGEKENLKYISTIGYWALYHCLVMP